MSDADYDAEIHVAGAGASETYPEQCSKMRKGTYVMIKNHPCKVMEMSTSKTGKHGHAKVHYVGLDVFTGKKYEDICPSTHSINVPHVIRSEQTVIDVEDGFMSVMDDEAKVSDIKAPSRYSLEEIKAMLELAEKNDEIVQAVIWKACKQEEVLELKTAKNKQ